MFQPSRVYCFSLKFWTYVLLRNAYKKVLRKCIFFLNWYILQLKIRKKIKEIHAQVFRHCYVQHMQKFQGKIVNPTLVGAPGSLFFLNKRHWFFAKNKSVSKIFYQYILMQNQCNKNNKVCTEIKFSRYSQTLIKL